MKPIGFVYLTTNIVNGKIYVGQHEIKGNKFADDYIGSGGTHFRNSVKKYGRENFKRKILKLCYTVNQLNGYETYYIKKLRATDPNIGYNKLPGPINLLNPSKLPEVSKIKSEKLSGSNNPMFGKKHTEETKRKMSEARKGKRVGKNNPMFGKESPFKGKRLSKEAKSILSEKAKERFKDKTKHPNYGKKWTEEQKKLQSEKLKNFYKWLYS